MPSVPARLFALLPALLLLAGCGDGPPRPALRPGSLQGVLLVTLSDGPETPPDAAGLGLSPVPFRSVSPEVLPSAASVLTGLLPPEHGLRVDGAGSLDAAVPTLASRFAARGYDCGAFLADAALSPVHGLARGFDACSARPDPTNRATAFRRSVADICGEAESWLAGRKDPSRPVFLWLHLAPRAGRAPTWLRPAPPPVAKASAAAPLAPLAPLLAAFAPDAPVLVVPLFDASAGAAGPDGAPAPRSLDPPDYPADAPTGFARSVRGAPGAGVSVADVPWLLGAADDPRPVYWESLVPWYAFRLPPLERRGSDAPSVVDGLGGPVVSRPLAPQSAMASLRAAGHLGEGLVPPLPAGTAPLDALAPEGEARVARWRAALAAPATNRIAALEALVASDPGVPLFAHALGDARFAAKDFAGAAAAYGDAARDGWNMVLAHRMQARCLVAAGDATGAIDAAEAAFLAGQEDPVPRRELADLLLRVGSALVADGDPASARACLDRTLLLEPGNPAARFENARLELRLGATNEAVRLLRDLSRDAPGFAPATILLRRLAAPARPQTTQN